ncbi:MAG: GxxExxY protein [Acidobacteria bacterium]|nr:GxxExxY protein [Acidobacteriota bacterium]
MNTDKRGYFDDAMTERVLGAIFEESNTLGAGFLEKVYQRALLHELRLRGIRAAAEVSFPVTYKGQGVGEYFAALVSKTAS